jgi:endoglucanase
MMHWRTLNHTDSWSVAFLPMILLAVSLAAGARGEPAFYAGVNLAGAEFGENSLPGTYNANYTYPYQTEVDYFRSKGMNIVRLCFRWERLQTATNAALNSSELGRLNTFVSTTTAKGLYVILDPHNYARYYNTNLIGSAGAPISAFSNFWWRVADIYRTNDHVIFGLVNEPNTMATEDWRDAAQAAIDAIRMAGATNLILVPGNAWTGAHSWLQNWYGTPNGTVMINLTDPANHFAYEVHQYLDSDSSGTSDTCISPTIGVERLANFTTWCRANGVRGFLGEFAGSTDSGCLVAVSNMLNYVQANTDVWMGWTWWAGGPWWGEYMFTLEPIGSTTDRAQMNVLEPFIPIPVPTLEIISSNRFRYFANQGFQYQVKTTSDPALGWTNSGSLVTGTWQYRTNTMDTNGSKFYLLQSSRVP